MTGGEVERGVVEGGGVEGKVEQGWQTGRERGDNCLPGTCIYPFYNFAILCQIVIIVS